MDYRDDFKQEVAPPSYGDTVSPTSAPKYQEPTNSSTLEIFAAQIQDQLQSLTQEVASLQTQKNLLTDSRDKKILSLLTTEIQVYFSNFAKSGSTRGSLTLIPAHAVEDESAVPTNDELRNPRHFDRIVKVRNKEADIDGIRDSLYWEDEIMAKRLAGYLRPSSNSSQGRPSPSPVRETRAPKERKASSGGLFGWSRRKAVSAVEEPLVIPRKHAVREIVQMRVRAQEETLRTENEYGLYEAQSGWGIVLTLELTLDSR